MFELIISGQSKHLDATLQFPNNYLGELCQEEGMNRGILNISFVSVLSDGFLPYLCIYPVWSRDRRSSMEDAIVSPFQ